MRTAVLGLFFLKDAERLPAVVADVCRITHQDLRSVAGGVAVAKAAQLLAAGHPATPALFCEEVAEAIAPYEEAFTGLVRGLPRLLEEGPETAVPAIAWSGMARPEFDEPIITPFIVPTVLAALWCLLRQPDSWPGAVASAIRLGGDVDTLGAIVGALLGARLGLAAIPRHLVAAVRHSERPQALAGRYHGLAVEAG
jgi:ADP-ribosylglycohydrolase